MRRWSTPMGFLLLAATSALAAAPANGIPDPAARGTYETAVKHVEGARYRDALPLLNGLAQDYPRVAEIFATRCSAQLGLGMNAGAEADCKYTLSLKPSLSSSVYGLARAEDNQGKLQAAVGHYQQYLAMPDAIPSLKASASERVQAISQPQPLPVAAPPPPPPAVEAPPVAAAPRAAPAAARATLYVYRNHYLSTGSGSLTLLVDDVLVGEILHDQFIEIQLPAGDHTVKACLNGIRQRSGLPNLEIHTGGGSIGASFSNGSDERYCMRPVSIPIEVPANGATYVNFDHQGNEVFLQQRPSGEAEGEMGHDCRKAFTKKL